MANNKIETFLQKRTETRNDLLYILTLIGLGALVIGSLTSQIFHADQKPSSRPLQ